MSHRPDGRADVDPTRRRMDRTATPELGRGYGGGVTSGHAATGDDDRPAGSTSEASTLRDLLTASSGGDRAAFSQLYDLTSARIYGLALRVIRDVHYAEEIVQESYLQYWQKADQYQPSRGSVITWMMTIAHRRAVDRVRTEELQQRKAAEYGAGNASTPHPIPLEVVVDREETRTLHTCLDRLTELQRASIEMSYFNGMTYPEVAAVTSTPLPTIKSRIRDGLRRLKKCLHGEADG